MRLPPLVVVPLLFQPSKSQNIKRLIVDADPDAIQHTVL